MIKSDNFKCRKYFITRCINNSYTKRKINQSRDNFRVDVVQDDSQSLLESDSTFEESELTVDVKILKSTIGNLDTYNSAKSTNKKLQILEKVKNILTKHYNKKEQFFNKFQKEIEKNSKKNKEIESAN